MKKQIIYSTLLIVFIIINTISCEPNEAVTLGNPFNGKSTAVLQLLFPMVVSIYLKTFQELVSFNNVLWTESEYNLNQAGFLYLYFFDSKVWKKINY